ncbi:MAG TPA: helix-turn-helix transcriptional regulator [Pseudonocardiaceae bacterium]|jgi:transcriptional regulator with XRE-family HTH domain|nr:helix-turn-helix transcriptional regulator [Pseudonocardiaceae bacterium]
MPSASTRWKKQLGSFLRELRKNAGKSVAQAADELHVKGPTLSQYEAGQNRPQWAAVVQLLQFYGATPAQLAEAEGRWEDAGAKALRVRMPADAPKDLRKLVRAELDARSVRVLSPSAVPGLLQTEPYIRAMNKAGHRLLDLAAMDEYIKARMNRQKLLTGIDPLHVHALIDEAAIRRVLGGPQIMRQQLGHLLLVGSWANVVIQVLPFGVGAYGPMGGQFMIVYYPEDGALPGVYLEYLGGGAWVDNEAGIERITTTFDDARAFALSPSDSADLIRQQQRALEQYDDNEHGVA